MNFLIPALTLLTLNVTYSFTSFPSFKSNYKRQIGDRWIWSNDDSKETNDIYRSRRYPQFNNNNDDDFFIFDTVEPTRPPAFNNNNNNNNNNNFDQFGNEEISTSIPNLEPVNVPVPGMGTTRSPCETSCLLTPQYNPVCGTDRVSYFSHERLLCAQRCGKNVQMNHLGKCNRKDQVV